MKDCKIVKDLLPSYIDGLTSEETNKYIEEHLNNCEECKKTLEDMKKDLKLDKTQKNGKEVQYIKKFNSKMKTLKIILIVILLVFLLSFARKMIIMVGLNIKASDHMSSTNYYVKTINYAGDTLSIIENYKKDDKYMRRFEILSDDTKSIEIDYYNNDIVNNYYELQNNEENVNKKVAKLNEIADTNLTSILYHIPNPLEIEMDNLLRFVVTALFSSITSEECNEKNCYRVVSFGSVYYIDKETGLTIRIVGGRTVNDDGQIYKMVSDYQYEFDMVTDENFIEPDISKYEINE